MALRSPEIIIIAALGASNRVIGRNGTLPWHLPEDLKRFRRLTTGHTLIMGRKTWQEGLGGRSLPQRQSLVVSRTLPPHPPKVMGDRQTTLCIVPSLDAAFHQVRHSSHPETQAFIIGGASIYAQTLHNADRLELTLVNGEFEGDAFFPDYQDLIHEKFHLTHQEDYGIVQFNSYHLNSDPSNSYAIHQPTSHSI